MEKLNWNATTDEIRAALDEVEKVFRKEKTDFTTIGRYQGFKIGETGYDGLVLSQDTGLLVDCKETLNKATELGLQWMVRAYGSFIDEVDKESPAGFHKGDLVVDIYHCNYNA